MELGDVIAKLAALEGQIHDLEQELARARVGGFRSMRDSRRCPACGGGRLLHIPKAEEHAHGASTLPLVVHHTHGFWNNKAAGPIEYFVCCGCLLVESHVTDLTGVEPDGTNVIAIEPEGDAPSGGPFR